MRKRGMLCGAALVVAIGYGGVQGAVIPLVYEDGPKIGQPFAGGPLTFQITNYEVGTLYSMYPAGTTSGYSGTPGSAVNGGVTTLDGLAGQVPPAGAQARGPYPGANGNQEDGWGIFKVNNIQDAAGNDLFTPSGKGEQLTGIFYGEQDFYLKQTTATGQDFSGVGLQADFYLSPTRNFDPTQGTAGRTAANAYPTATDGAFVMHVASVPGFINGPGVLGGTATEFQSSFDYATTTGRGQAFADVTAGDEMAILHTGTFASAFGFGNADINFTYTDVPAATGDWLVKSNDPISANTVPEPASLGLLGVAVGSLVLRRNRRR